MDNQNNRKYYGSESLTISSTVVSLTQSIYGDHPNYLLEAEIYVETAQIRVAFSPAGPNTGLAVEVGQNFKLYNQSEIENARLIRGGSTDATVRVLYFKTSTT